MKRVRSLRWRLPLSYAGLACLAILTLGALLLGALKDYYAKQEQDYLWRNGQAISIAIAPELEQDSLEVVTTYLEVFSYLSQTRIRLLDPNGEELVDTGVSGWGQTVRVIDLPGVIDADQRLPWPGPLPAAPEIPPIDVGRLRLSELDVAPFPIFRDDSQRSDQQLLYTVYSKGEVLGYLHLSGGLAYGKSVVDSVAQMWMFASPVAVLVAGGVGWLVSRQITTPLSALTEITARMTAGDLSARTGVTRRDELGTLATSFDEMAARIEQTVITLRHFIADAAHELHTPLTALKTNLELINDDPDRVEVRRALEQLDRLKTLTDDLLDLSRIESRSDEAEQQPVSMADLVREMSEVYAARAEQADLEYQLDVSDQIPPVNGNAGQLRRLVANLLDNAVKFTGAGGAILVRLEQRNQQLELSVQDTGIGIPSEDAPRLFGRFHRACNAVGYPGSGLGLAIVKAVVDAHNGEVNVESDANGTIVTVVLPLAV